MATRKYDQRLRAASAAETRRRILDAVAERVRSSPTDPVSVDAVASVAKVSRSTVYVTFGSKAGLLDAFAQDLWERTGLAALTEAVASEDVREHLRRGIDASCRMYAADVELYRVLFAMSRLDPSSVGGAIVAKEAARTGGMDHLARRLSDAGALRDDVTVGDATDLLWMLCSFEAFELLHTGRGLSVDDAVSVLVSTAERSLCR